MMAVTSTFSKTSLYFRLSWIFIAILALIPDECWCLRDVHLVVLPSAVERGGSVILLCQYDLQGAPLYSVSWYRGTHEFYRHSPSEIPTIKLFKFNGIHVDDTLSNSTQVVLSDVSFSLSGNFSCEVTTDAPFFSAQTASSELTVIELPETPPILMVERDRYTLGDTLRANCTSPPSRPPAELTFQVNGMTVGVGAVERYGADSPLLSRHSSTSNTLNGGQLNIGGVGVQQNPWNPPINSNNNFLPNTIYNISNGQQWTTATLNIQLLPMHFGALYNNANFYNHASGTGSNTNNGIEPYANSYSSNTGSSSSSNYYRTPNTLQVTCTAHIAPGDYHRSTNVQLVVRLGEPVHERVMSPSRGTTFLVTIHKTLKVVSATSILLITLLLF